MKPGTAVFPWGPVTERDRFLSVDALRGLAIFGVVLANSLTFAFPMIAASSEPEAALGSGIADRIAALLIGILVEGKFYTLLSVLFGMGLAMQSDKAVMLGLPFARFYVRRCIILFAIGILHGVILYSADILSFYALVALVALLFRKASTRVLLAAGMSAFLLGLFILGFYALQNPRAPIFRTPDWDRLIRAHESSNALRGESRFPPQAPAGGESQESRDALTGFHSWALGRLSIAPLDFYRLMASERRIFQTGTWTEMTQFRAAAYFLIAFPVKTALLGMIVLAYFLLGMYLARSGIFLDLEAHRRVYRRLLVTGGMLGMLLQLAGSGFQSAAARHAMMVPMYWLAVLGGSLGVSLAYGSGLALLCAKFRNDISLRALAAVGRLALTNYLSQSLIFGMVFYGTGLGLFMRVGAASVVLIALLTFSFQIAFSMIWLRRFRSGPMEWVWRRLSYGAAVPLA